MLPSFIECDRNATPNTMLSKTNPSSRQYNSIPRFEDQVHSIPFTHLLLVAEIFVKHKMHLSFGVGLLHRHQGIEPNHMMVSTDKGPAVVCEMQLLDDGQSVAPCSFYLNDDGIFYPFEYRAGLDH